LGTVCARSRRPVIGRPHCAGHGPQDTLRRPLPLRKAYIYLCTCITHCLSRKGGRFRAFPGPARKVRRRFYPRGQENEEQMFTWAPIGGIRRRGVQSYNQVVQNSSRVLFHVIETTGTSPIVDKSERDVARCAGPIGTNRATYGASPRRGRRRKFSSVRLLPPTDPSSKIHRQRLETKPTFISAWLVRVKPSQKQE
jgi:hypothetical protein